MRRLSALVLCLAALSAAPLGAQSVEAVLSLDDGDPLNIPDDPFGIAMDPDGIHAFVAVSGNYGTPLQNNRRILRIDVWTRTIVAEALVGLFPEDIAVTRDALGAARHVFVTSSTSSEVHILTPALVPAAPPIPLGTCGVLPSQYPFGIVATPDSTRVVVTTVGGCGPVFVIDADPASAAFGSVLFAPMIPGAHGRPSVSGSLIVIPTSVFAPDYSFARAEVQVLDPVLPGSIVASAQLGPAVPGWYAAGLDSAILPDGRALITVNGAPVPTLYEFDPVLSFVTREIPLGAQAGTAVHGLAVAPAGHLAVVTSQDAHSLVFVDVPQGSVIATVSTGPSTQPNEAVFTRDGSRLLVTLQTAAAVQWWKDLPLRNLVLATPATAPLGGAALLGVSGGDWSRIGGIFASLGAGPTTFGNITVSLAEPIELLAAAPFDMDGAWSASFPIPAGPATLSGVTFHLQGGTVDRDGALRFSGGAAVTLQ